MKKVITYKQDRIGKKYGLEMDFSAIGEGILLCHPFNITINPAAVIGCQATIFKGTTVGSIRSGKKKGTPKIGDRVTLCSNCLVCGNISIGNDVLIAGNAFVNFDVPPHSIVIGNPGIIKTKRYASIDYLD